MGLWFLAAAAIVLVAVLVYASYLESVRGREILSEIEVLRNHRHQGFVLVSDFDSGLKRIEGILAGHIEKTEATFKKAREQIEILEVRQRTLEKRIISNERTVNVVFKGSIPIEKVIGRGKSALIDTKGRA